ERDAGLRQLPLSACHELFHCVCWNHPRYRADEGRGFARLRSVVAESRALVDAFPRYRDWVTGSFLRQGDHANVVEYFADIPTNFRDAHQLPPPIAAHFAPLIDGSPFPSEFDTALADGGNDLAAFQRSLAPAERRHERGRGGPPLVAGAPPEPPPLPTRPT